MKSNRALVRYKHSTIGKFKEIMTVVSPLDDFKEVDGKYFEVFAMIHELILNMIPVSSETISEMFSQEAVLYVVDTIPSDKNSKKMTVSGVEIYSLISSKGMFYYYVPSLDDDEAILNLGKVMAFLPTVEAYVETKRTLLKERMMKLV